MGSAKQHNLPRFLGPVIVAVAMLTALTATASAGGPYGFCSLSYSAYQTCQDSVQHSVTRGDVYPTESGCFRVANSSFPSYYCFDYRGGHVDYPYPYPYGNPTCHEHAGATPDYITCYFYTG